MVINDNPQKVQEILSPYTEKEQMEIGKAIGYLSKATEYVADENYEAILKCMPHLAEAIVYMLKYPEIFGDEGKTFTLIQYALEGEEQMLN